MINVGNRLLQLLDVCRRVAELSQFEITFQYQHWPPLTIISCPRTGQAGPRPRVPGLAPAFPGCDVSGASGAQAAGSGERGLSRSYSEGSVSSAELAISPETALLQDIRPEAGGKTGECPDLCQPNYVINTHVSSHDFIRRTIFFSYALLLHTAVNVNIN